MQNLLDEIESHTFLARVLGVERLSSLLRRIDAEPAVRQLSHLVENNPILQKRLYDHISVLLAIDSDERLRHPLDVAFTVYLRVLDDTSHDLSFPTRLVRQKCNTWWSHRLAARIANRYHNFSRIDLNLSHGGQFLKIAQVGRVVAEGMDFANVAATDKTFRFDNMLVWKNVGKVAAAENVGPIGFAADTSQAIITSETNTSSDTVLLREPR
jgi:hypothetical protein